MLCGSQAWKQHRDQAHADALDVPAKFIMEVGGAEDNALAPERLLAAGLPGAGGRPFDGGDVHLLYGDQLFVLLEKTVE